MSSFSLPHFLNFIGVELDFFLAHKVYEIYQDTGETTEACLARAAQVGGLRKKRPISGG